MGNEQLTDPTSCPGRKGHVKAGVPHIHLRLLETTDVHSNLLPFDYYADNCETTFGLARTATLIHEARREVANCLLLDNGDFLQGTPLSDLTAQPNSGWAGPHPAVMAMNYLNYDAAGLGNHEFNFGLDWLQSVLVDAEFPITCANAVTGEGATPSEDQTLYPPYLLLDRTVTDSAGGQHDLRIGVLGLVPPQVTTWDHVHLNGRLVARDMVETARLRVPQMRAEGADIVVLLAHTGIDPDVYYPFKENAALALGGVTGVDAVLAGHTHEIFPEAEKPETDRVRHRDGTLGGTPAVMAGFRGSHLGVLDLYLQHDGAAWNVSSHETRVRAVQSSPEAEPTPPDDALKQLLMPAHKHTLDLIRKPLGRSDVPLHSYLALVRNDPATQMIARAKREELRRLLRGTAEAALPVLATSAPFKTGGRGGPKYYSEVAPGDIRLRNAADLYAFPNTLYGLRLTGAQIRDWLERAAVCFNQVVPGQPDQPLFDPLVPGHNFDVIHGVTYAIDLSQPARYDRHGALASDGAHRITDLRYDGALIADDDLFVVATSNFRAYGGGPYPEMPESCFALASRIPVRDIISQYVGEVGTLSRATEPIWSFAPLPDTSVIFDTGPGIRRYPDETAALGAIDLGDTRAGFARFRLPLMPQAPQSLANPPDPAYVSPREVGAGERLANPVRSGRKQP